MEKEVRGNFVRKNSTLQVVPVRGEILKLYVHTTVEYIVDNTQNLQPYKKANVAQNPSLLYEQVPPRVMNFGYF